VLTVHRTRINPLPSDRSANLTVTTQSHAELRQEAGVLSVDWK